MCAGPMLTIKNTFICIVDSEDLSPVGPTRRRAATSPTLHDLISCSSTGTPTSVLDDSSADPDFFGDGDGATSSGEEASERAASVSSAGLAEPGTSRLADVALDRRGCLVLQRAIEDGRHCVPDIVAALRGHVLEASRCSHGHEVLLSAIHYLRMADAAFVAEELLGHGREVAVNSCGSLVLSQLLTFSADDARTAAVVDETLALNIDELVCHKFGHRVAQAVMECGLPHQKCRIVGSLLKNLQRFARHRFASLVVESAILFASQADSHAICAALVRSQGAVLALACHSFGIRLVRAMLEVSGFARVVVEYLSRGQQRLAKDKYGLQLIRSLGLHIPAAAVASEGGADARVVTCTA